MYYVIEQIHTLPNVSYLAKIRNTDELVEKEGDSAGHAAQGTDSKVPGGHEPAPEKSETH
jgi:molybdopterin-containing oxidoreductase family iron-sulfur binding subunit